MPENKLKLDKNTSIEELSRFFQELGDNSQVRTRKSNGVIVLYERGSSKWHVFTDMLRPDFLVKRDYAAANHIIGEAFAHSDVSFRQRTGARPDTDPFFNITSKRHHDFYGKEIKSELRTLHQNATTRSSDLKMWFFRHFCGLRVRYRAGLAREMRDGKQRVVSIFVGCERAMDG